MKPRVARKFLQVANVIFLGGVIAIGAWFLARVRPAAAEVVGRPPAHSDFATERRAYEQRRAGGLAWQPDVPVGDEIFTHILRADYALMDPPHWPFSGPLPSGKRKAPDDGIRKPAAPEGLDVLGTVRMVIYAPPDGTLVSFAFTGGKVRPFGIGEFVRESRAERKRFRIIGVHKVEEDVFEIEYAVHGADPENPERTDVMMHGRPFENPLPDVLRHEDPSDMRAEPGGRNDAAPEAPRERRPGVTASGIEPRVEIDPGDPTRRTVRLHAHTYEVLGRVGARGIAAGIKTAPAVDKKTGRTRGLLITGMQPGSAASVFQVRKGDILVSIEGRAATSRAEAIRIVESLDPGSKVTIVIERRGELLTFVVDPSDPHTRREARRLEIGK